MKLKRFFAAALAGTLLALSLTACGGNTNADTNTDASNDTAASTGSTLASVTMPAPVRRAPSTVSDAAPR